MLDIHFLFTIEWIRTLGMIQKIEIVWSNNNPMSGRLILILTRCNEGVASERYEAIILISVYFFIIWEFVFIYWSFTRYRKQLESLKQYQCIPLSYVSNVINLISWLRQPSKLVGVNHIAAMCDIKEPTSGIHSMVFLCR